MANRKNGFDGPLQELLRTLAEIHHASYLSSWMVKRMVQDGERTLKNWDDEKPRPGGGVIGVGTRLIVPDYANAKPIPKGRPHVGFSVKDDQALKLAKEVEMRLQGQLLCGAFEASEKYLKDVGGEAYFRSRNFPEHHDVKLTVQRKKFQWKGSKSDEGTPVFYDDYVTSMCRGGCGWLVRQLQAGLPYFRNSPHQTEMLKYVMTWYDTVEFCRHKIVHSFGHYNVDELKALSKEGKDWVIAITRRSLLSETEVMLPAGSAVNNMVQILAGLAFFIYRALSSSFNMDESLDLLPIIEIE